MLNKIFLILFAAAVLFMGAFSYLTNSNLTSIGFPPVQIIDTFTSYESVHWMSLWVSSLVLLVVSNVILWTNRKSWALWLTFAFFAFFIMVNTWWLTENLKTFQAANNLNTAGLLSKNGVFGAIFCVVGGIAIYFNQFIVFRLRDKMFSRTKETPTPPETVAEEEKAE